MIKKTLFLAIALTLTQTGFSEQPAIDMEATNKAHAGINAKKANQPFWSEGQKKYADLEKKYQQAIASDPDNKKNYAYLAGVYLSANKTLKAIDAYQDAITMDPENAKLFAAISIAYLHQSKYAMAKSMASQALIIDPSLKSVGKINEYIVAKLEVIDAATKVPSGGKTPDMSKYTKGMSDGHGSVMPIAIGKKPTDKTHTPN